MDENVIPVVEELQRRLPPVNAICRGQGDDDVEAGEEDDGMRY
jgi:magnesium transporter